MRKGRKKYNYLFRIVCIKYMKSAPFMLVKLKQLKRRGQLRWEPAKPSFQVTITIFLLAQSLSSSQYIPTPVIFLLLSEPKACHCHKGPLRGHGNYSGYAQPTRAVLFVLHFKHVKIMISTSFLPRLLSSSINCVTFFSGN